MGRWCGPGCSKWRGNCGRRGAAGTAGTAGTARRCGPRRLTQGLAFQPYPDRPTALPPYRHLIIVVVITAIAVVYIVGQVRVPHISSVSRRTFSWRADYVDIREDRIIFYGDFDSKVRELTYKVKLTAAGDFSIPPSYAESMYDRSLRAISESGRFKVTRSK